MFEWDATLKTCNYFLSTIKEYYHVEQSEISIAFFFPKLLGKNTRQSIFLKSQDKLFSKVTKKCNLVNLVPSPVKQYNYSP